MSGIERSSAKEGINGKCSVIAVSEGTRFAPATESLGAVNSRTMGTCSLGREIATGVGHLGDGDIVLCVDKCQTGMMVYERIGQG